MLKIGLVNVAGLDRLEVEELLRPHAGLQLNNKGSVFTPQSEALPEAPGAMVEAVEAAIQRLPPSLNAYVGLDPAGGIVFLLALLPANAHRHGTRETAKRLSKLNLVV